MKRLKCSKLWKKIISNGIPFKVHKIIECACSTRFRVVPNFVSEDLSPILPLNRWPKQSVWSSAAWSAPLVVGRPSSTTTTMAMSSLDCAIRSSCISPNDELKTQFMTREGTYRLMTLSEYSRPNRVGYANNGQGAAGVSAPVKVSFATVPANSSALTPQEAESGQVPILLNSSFSSSSSTLWQKLSMCVCLWLVFSAWADIYWFSRSLS